MLSYRSFTFDKDFFQAAQHAPVVVVSPHYDDAIFSCGELLSMLPTSTVLTVCTGVPENDALSTDWDRRCGFSSARQAMQARCLENAAALSVLDASGVDLGFLDSQYIAGSRMDSELLADTVASNIEQLKPSSVIFPLGLFHKDHIHISDTFVTICGRYPGINWMVYEDIPYRNQAGCVAERLSQLIERGIPIEPFGTELAGDYKIRAVHAYQSQFLGLGHRGAAPVMHLNEKFWRLHCNMGLP
jgi:LmbE family N-acetylglucosaminyl deacetylase